MIQGSACAEWHPVIVDIVDPDKNKNRIVQYKYFDACIKLLQATVPPPSIERSRSAFNGSASRTLATLNSNGPHQKPSVPHHVYPAPGGHQTSSTVDSTGSVEKVPIKREVPSVSASINQIQAPSTQIDERIKAFRDKLDKKEVEELQQMLEKQLPSWIKKLAEDVLQKKMLRELDLAESYLL